MCAGDARWLWLSQPGHVPEFCGSRSLSKSLDGDHLVAEAIDEVGKPELCRLRRNLSAVTMACICDTLSSTFRLTITQSYSDQWLIFSGHFTYFVVLT